MQKFQSQVYLVRLATVSPLMIPAPKLHNLSSEDQLQLVNNTLRSSHRPLV
jgi:hypothetical protein